MTPSADHRSQAKKRPRPSEETRSAPQPQLEVVRAKAAEAAAKAEVAQAAAAQAIAKQACAAAEARAEAAEAAEAAAKGPASKRKLSLPPDHPFAERPAKEARPAPQSPTPPAAPSPASYAATSSSLRPNERVRVWWDKETYFDGRVIDTHSELGRSGAVQQRFQEAYDDGDRRWHVCDVASGMCVELLAEEVCEEAVCDEWLPLELR